MPRRGTSVARLLGGPPVPDDVARHPLLDERYALLRDSLEVEGLGQSALVESVVPDREARVKERLAQPAGEIAALLEERERVQRGEAEVEQQLRDRVRLQNGTVGAGLGCLGASSSLRLFRCLAGHGRGIEIAGPPGACLRVAGGIVARRKGEHARVGQHLRGAVPGGRGRGDLRDAARVVPVEPVVRCSRDRLCGGLRLLLGGEPGSRLVAGLDHGDGRRLLQAGEPRVGGRAVGGLGRAARSSVQALVVGPVRDGDAPAPVAYDADGDRLVADQRRLVHLRAGEAREPGLLDLRDRVRAVAFGGSTGPAGELECPIALAHERTPTWTSRKRAGAVPCETCADWPGCPLPQLVIP